MYIYTHMICIHIRKHKQVVPLLARGTYESSLKVSAKRLDCNKFLADMVMSRISRSCGFSFLQCAVAYVYIYCNTTKIEIKLGFIALTYIVMRQLTKSFLSESKIP